YDGPSVGPKAKGNASPDASVIIAVSHKVMARPMGWLSFPNAAPFGAKRSPFSGTACVSQALGPSELIPCIRLQTHEIELTVRNPHRCGCCYLSAFVRHRR